MYYKIITNKGTEQVDIERVNSLIQLCENQLEGYKEVIEDEKPQEQEGYYIASDYKIINGEVHQVYRLEPIPQETEFEEETNFEEGV